MLGLVMQREADIHRASVPMEAPLMSVNCYLLSEGDDAYLVDTAWTPQSTPDHVTTLLSEAGVRPQELTGIILTHCHRDHIGHLVRLQAMTGVPVLLHTDEAKTLSLIFGAYARRRRELQSWFQSHGVPVGAAADMLDTIPKTQTLELLRPHWLSGGDVIRVGSRRWRVLLTSGHSPGHICLFEPERRLLLTGDHILNNESPNIGAWPGSPIDPLGRYMTSVRYLASLGIDWSLPGHGEPFQDVERLIGRQLSHHQFRLNDTMAALAGRPRTAFEVANSVPWVRRSMRFEQLPARHRYLAFGETLAHLQHLEALNMVQRSMASPIVWWVVAKTAE
jgi:glyoxylase-like metal-dependent hydrolase (beta-lactamase superfamily II)